MFKLLVILYIRKQHNITEIPGLSPARMRIWQKWLLVEVTLQFTIFSLAMLISLYDVIIWGDSATSSTLNTFMKFLSTSFKFWLRPYFLQKIGYTFFYKQLVCKQLALSLKIAKQHKITDYRKDYRLRSDLHCWTKATKQSKSLLFTKNFFEQSEKLIIWSAKKSWENTRKMFIRPHY